MDFTRFDESKIKELHGDMYTYRKLYKGDHAEIFERAKELIEKGEVIDYLQNGVKRGNNVKTPYLVYNISKIICDTPAMLISRSIGEVLTNHKYQEATDEESTSEETEMLEGTQDGSINEEVIDLQQETLTQIVTNSKLKRKHKSNIVQQQVDGGIVGVPVMKNGNVSIQFKERNVYYPHDDGLGADLVYELDNKLDNSENDYVHVYTERMEQEDLMVATNKLYSRNRQGELSEVTDNNIIKEVIGIDSQNLRKEFKGRRRLFIDYWANNANFIDPLGVSELEGQLGKQEEVNWTLTRTSQTFERNGKPRISITSDLFDRLENLARDRGTDRIDHRDLEITEMDEQGNSLKIHQIEIDKIGDIQYIKDITTAMLAETNTSKTATEIFDEKGGTASAQSGIAKFYDLFISLIKAEGLRNEYIEFLQNLFESALWLANKNNPNIIIEKPYIETDSMIPTPKEEMDLNSINKFNSGIQSLETTIREVHIDKSDEWIESEIERINGDKSNDDSGTLTWNRRQSLQEILGNRSADGTPLNPDGTPVEEDEE